MTTLQTTLDTLNAKRFVIKLQQFGEVYIVGGMVRDAFLNKQSKDIDLLVTGIPILNLTELLKPYGKVDLVGDSFGVIKFMPTDMKLDEPIDIAIPRTEALIGIGHKDFEVIASHDIPVEVDLKRRDFTINAIAVKLDGTVIDPFGGMNDLNSRLIKMVDDVAFTDDPLRMARAVQFASRFNFKIEANTLNAIKTHAVDIKRITPERILTELDKIQTKGDASVGFDLLVKTGLYKNIFGFDENFDDIPFGMVQSRGDFFFTILRKFDYGAPITFDTPQSQLDFETKSKAFKLILKGDNETAKTLDAIQFGFDNSSLFVKPCRMVAFQMYKMSKLSFDSCLLPTSLKLAVKELTDGVFPKTLKELAINGNDLIALGMSDKQIGDTLHFALQSVFDETVTNDKQSLLNLISK